MGTPLRLYIIAGEPSGDKLGAALMAGLKELHPDVEFHGVGGPLMASEGLDSLFEMADLSVMGLLEVLPRLPKLIKRIRQTVVDCIQTRPDALITIDSPDFCLRVAGKVREHSRVKTIHYVAPSVWAWRPERAEKMARHIDHVLALLPFEPPLMQAAGMTCDFVGHPIVAEPVATDAQTSDFRTRHGLDGPIMTILPGSRKGEITRLAPIFGQVVAQVGNRYPDIQFVLPTVGSARATVEAQVANWPVKPMIVELSEADKRALFKTSTCALAASGTVSLELAAAGCAHVVAYQANWATTRMVKKLAQIETASLVSILDESRVVPEFLFENCTLDSILPAVLSLLDSPETRAKQQSGFERAMVQLGKDQPDIGLKAAHSVLAALKR